MMVKIAMILLMVCLALLMALITGYAEQLQDRENGEWKDDDDV